MLGLSVFRSHLLPGAVRQRHGVGGGAPVTFGRRRRCAAGPKISSAWAARRGRRGVGGEKNFFQRFPKKFRSILKFLMTNYRRRGASGGRLYFDHLILPNII